MNFIATQNQILYNYGASSNTAGQIFQNAASLDYIFDQYRIDKVVIDIYFSTNCSWVGQAPLPMVYLCEDQDDSANLATIGNALSYGNCKVLQFGNSSGNRGGKQTITMTKPTVPFAVANFTGGNVEMGLNVSPWLNSNSNQVEHLGIKMFVDAVTGTSAVVGTFTFVFKQYMSYKNIR